MAITASTSLGLKRFGLGPRKGDLGRIGSDPQGALLEELARADAAKLDGGELVPSHVAHSRNRAAEEQRRVARLGMAATPNAPVPPNPTVEEDIVKAESRARYFRQATTPDGFLERLVLFWSNHFCVALSKSNEVRVLAGPFEREAIRPNILGRFATMVRAVEQHPAMLLYLDNTQSIGPNSRVGNNGRRGLNENLAREIMELHTLGVGGGYSQADVTSLSRIITGWTVTSPDDDALYGGRFTFAPTRHEPGAHLLLGKSYAEPGLAQGEAALTDLARHPSTARFLARKLAAHFVADDPPPVLVERLAKIFLDSEGDLRELAKALVRSPEAWAGETKKLRTPMEFLVAAARLTGPPADSLTIGGPLPALGQPLWNPSGPNGFPDRSDFWATPEGMSTRLDVAARLGEAAAKQEPAELMAEAFGGFVSDATKEAVARAGSRQQAIAIMMMSPEFQRR